MTLTLICSNITLPPQPPYFCEDFTCQTSKIDTDNDISYYSSCNPITAMRPYWVSHVNVVNSYHVAEYSLPQSMFDGMPCHSPRSKNIGKFDSVREDEFTDYAYLSKLRQAGLISPSAPLSYVVEVNDFRCKSFVEGKIFRNVAWVAGEIQLCYLAGGQKRTLHRSCRSIDGSSQQQVSLRFPALKLR